MIDRQTEFPDPQITASCDAYLTEMNIRISKMRDLVRQMENRKSPVGWLKQMVAYR